MKAATRSAAEFRYLLPFHALFKDAPCHRIACVWEKPASPIPDLDNLVQISLTDTRLLNLERSSIWV
jgi:hypothetical protein